MNWNDGWFPDFDDVKVGTIVLVEKTKVLNKYSWKEARIDLHADDIWIVEELTGRPRRASIRNLQRNVFANIRVDELLDTNYDGTTTIGPR